MVLTGGMEKGRLFVVLQTHAHSLTHTYCPLGVKFNVISGLLSVLKLSCAQALLGNLL